MVEYFTKRAISEIQTIKVIHAGASGSKFLLDFMGDISSPIPHDIDAYDLRHVLMENFNQTLNHIEVTRRAIPHGYEWDITFAQNEGNQYPFVCESKQLKSATSIHPTCNVIETRSGRRANGIAEVQELRLKKDAKGW